MKDLGFFITLVFLYIGLIVSLIGRAKYGGARVTSTTPAVYIEQFKSLTTNTINAKQFRDTEE